MRPGPLNNTTLPAEDRAALVAFQDKVQELRRSIAGAVRVQDEMAKRVEVLQKAVAHSPKVPLELSEELAQMRTRLQQLDRALNGDYTRARREYETPPAISDRVGRIVYGLWESTSAPTQTMQDAYDIAAEAFEPAYEELKAIVSEMQELEKKLEGYGAPYTPGRMPLWQRE